MIKVEPYLTFDGNCCDALSFYMDVFQGVELKVVTFKDQKAMMQDCGPECDMEITEEWEAKIMFASFSLPSGPRLMMSDRMKNRPYTPGNDIAISLDFTSETEMEEIFKKLSQDGKVEMPISKMFWNAMFGVVKDKFDKRWLFNCQIHD